MQSSVREIRTRLLILLLRAFVIVLFLSFLFFTFIIGYFITSTSTPIPFPFVSRLEGYYLAKGSWDGAEIIFDSMDNLDMLNVLLLDEEQSIVLDRRSNSPSTAGSRYEIQREDVVIDLKVQDQVVGYIVLTAYSLSARFGIARAVLFPLGIISCILAVFLVIVSVLLVRRFVNPLADVIYAAHEVTDGKLNTRISSEGPQDLRRLSDSFNEMASALERNDLERRDLLADIAHELRTPLSVIRGRLEGIVDGVYAVDDGTQVPLALEQTYLLERLVDDLRLLTLVETRQLHFEKKSVDLAQLSGRIVDMFSAEAQEKNISLALEKKGDDFHVEVDPQRMEQVIGNLVGNALRYVPDGSKIWLLLEESQAEVKLSVQDNGPGVAEEELPYLFDRFWRKEKSRARSGGGTGLGLAIARQLVEAQNGTIEASNRLEGGLQVLIALRKQL